MGLDGYVGGFETQQRARRLQEERDERAREFDVRKQQQQQQRDEDGGGRRGGGFNNRSSLVGFRGSSTVEEEKAFANQSVGLLTREEYAKKQEKVRLELEKEREAKERTRREKRERQKRKTTRGSERRKLIELPRGKRRRRRRRKRRKEEEDDDERRAKKVKKRSNVGVNPDADTSHVPNAQKEQMKEERVLRDQLAREFLEKKRKQMEENLTVTFSYWSGGGGRRSVTVKQKDTIRTFLKTAMKSMEEELERIEQAQRGEHDVREGGLHHSSRVDVLRVDFQKGERKVWAVVSVRR